MNTALITSARPDVLTREHNGHSFTFREDGWFNMTKAAKAFGKRLQDFMDNKETQEYILALRQSINAIQRELTVAQRGYNGGTWAHPKLAIFFARWLDVRFAVWCDAVIEDILTKKAELVITKPQESALMALPQNFSEALRALADAHEKQEALDKENKALEARNKELHFELNHMTIGEFQRHAKRYFTQSEKNKLARHATAYCELRGIEIKREEKLVVTSSFNGTTAVKVYPLAALQYAHVEVFGA